MILNFASDDNLDMISSTSIATPATLECEEAEGLALGLNKNKHNLTAAVESNTNQNPDESNGSEPELNLERNVTKLPAHRNRTSDTSCNEKATQDRHEQKPENMEWPLMIGDSLLRDASKIIRKSMDNKINIKVIPGGKFRM